MRISVFKRFSPDDILIFRNYDRESRLLYADSQSSGFQTQVLFPDDFYSYQIQEDEKIGVKYGKISKTLAECSNGKLRKGDHCVSAYRYNKPKALPLALALLRWSLGEAEFYRNMAIYVAHANSSQKQFTRQHGDCKINFRSFGGTFAAEGEIAPGCEMQVDGIRIENNLPRAVASSMAGRRIGEIIDHPAFVDAAVTVEEVRHLSSGSFIALSHEYADLTPWEQVKEGL